MALQIEPQHCLNITFGLRFMNYIHLKKINSKLLKTEPTYHCLSQKITNFSKKDLGEKCRNYTKIFFFSNFKYYFKKNMCMHLKICLNL